MHKLYIFLILCYIYGEIKMWIYATTCIIWVTIEAEIKYEGFGGGPLVGGGPGARAPWAPLKSGPDKQ